MLVVQYRYRLVPGAYPAFRALMERVYEIYKENGALYHIVLVDEKRDGDVCETLYFADDSVRDRFTRMTAENLELGHLLGRFAALVSTPPAEIEERVYATLFDSAG